jgi:hypothetical protein
MSYMLQPQILLLKEGTDDSQGRNQIISNINACVAIQEVLKTTLGPRGMDKMIETSREHTVTNDGATIVELLDVIHPAALLSLLPFVWLRQVFKSRRQTSLWQLEFTTRRCVQTLWISL